MQVVVADTTPVRYLAEIGHLDLLPRLFETIFIPSVVYEELQHPASPQIVRAVFQPASCVAENRRYSKWLMMTRFDGA